MVGLTGLAGTGLTCGANRTVCDGGAGAGVWSRGPMVGNELEFCSWCSCLRELLSEDAAAAAASVEERTAVGGVALNSTGRS